MTGPRGLRDLSGLPAETRNPDASGVVGFAEADRIGLARSRDSRPSNPEAART